MSAIGRNDPCPCGSGKKFKKCHGQTVSITTPSEQSRADAEKALDYTLVERMMKFSKRRAGKNWLDRAISVYSEFDETPVDELELQFVIPWALYEFPLTDEDVTVAQLYAAEKYESLPPDLQRILDANLDAWLSVWEVREIEKNVGMLVSDLLTGEERFVHERSGSIGVEVRAALLARVVTSNGISFFGGSHPQPLSPRDAAFVVGHGKRLCRVRTRPVKPEKLQDPDVQMSIISVWRLIANQRTHARLPILTNTDGDLMAPTVDHYEIAADDRSKLLARLASIPGAQEAEFDREDGRMSVHVTKDSGSTAHPAKTIIGIIRISSGRLRVECNSARRADALKSAIESSAGDLVRYRLREEDNIEEIFREAEAHAGGDRGDVLSHQTPEMAAIAREYRERYMTQWLDMSVPALKGLTPRDASKKAASRKALETLLREMEMHEGRLPEQERIDLEKLRKELGMED